MLIFQLKPIEYLLGTTAKLGEVIVLGMLTQLKEVRPRKKICVVQVTRPTLNVYPPPYPKLFSPNSEVGRE